MFVFWRKGFKQTSVDDLVHETGVNRYALYGEFGGPEGLYKKACEHYCDFIRERLWSPLEQSEDAALALRRMFFDLIDSLLDDSLPEGCMVGNAINEGASRDDKLTPVGPYFSGYATAFKAALRRLHPSASKAEIERSILTLTNGVFGLAALSRIETSRSRLRWVAEDTISCARASLP